MYVHVKEGEGSQGLTRKTGCMCLRSWGGLYGACVFLGCRGKGQMWASQFVEGV